MDLIASGQVFDQIETPYGCTLVGRVGNVGREEKDFRGHACNRWYSLRVSRAAFSQEKS